MSLQPLSAHERHSVFKVGRRIAAELAGAACDPSSRLPMADRMALAALSLAVDEETRRRASLPPDTADALPLLAADLARVEAAGL